MRKLRLRKVHIEGHHRAHGWPGCSQDWSPGETLTADGKLWEKGVSSPRPLIARCLSKWGGSEMLEISQRCLRKWASPGPALSLEWQASPGHPVVDQVPPVEEIPFLGLRLARG